MGFYKKRWSPSSSQKREYHQRMLAIEAAKQESPKDGYDIDCTGDCCVGDNIAFFNAGKCEERMYGVIVADSYGADKQQHTFTVLLSTGDKVLIKGRNLYKNGVKRMKWDNEENREKVLDEKHERGDAARAAKKARKEASYPLDNSAFDIHGLY